MSFEYYSEEIGMQAGVKLPALTAPTPTLDVTHMRTPSMPINLTSAPAGNSLKNVQSVANYSYYTPYEWTQMNQLQYNNADTNRNSAERLRNDACKLIRETEEKAYSSQHDTNRRIGERLSDINFWRNELVCEIERMLCELHSLQYIRRGVEKATQNYELPLNIALECLYQREARQGVDKVKDGAEEALTQEVSTLRNCQEKLNHFHRRVLDQLQENRQVQHELELDLKSKECTLEIDNTCYQLNNSSSNINFFIGIEKFDQTQSVPETWAEKSNRTVQKSQSIRVKSVQLRSEAGAAISECTDLMWSVWNFTNNALCRRANEILETKNELQMHLHKTQQEIYDMEKSIDMIRAAIEDKSHPLKVAQTRLEYRTHRRDIELCKDSAHCRLQKEVVDLEDSIRHLKEKLVEAENQHQTLLLTRSNLQAEIKLKSNSLFIDKEKCLGIRKSCPITARDKY